MGLHSFFSFDPLVSALTIAAILSCIIFVFCSIFQTEESIETVKYFAAKSKFYSLNKSASINAAQTFLDSLYGNRGVIPNFWRLFVIAIMLNFSMFVYLLSPSSFSNETLTQEFVQESNIPSLIILILAISVLFTELITVLLTRYLLKRAVNKKSYVFLIYDAMLLILIFFIIPSTFIYLKMSGMIEYANYNPFTYAISDYGEKDPNPIVLTYFMSLWDLGVLTVTPALNICIFINEFLRFLFQDVSGVILVALILPTFSLCLPTFLIILSVSFLHFRLVAKPLFWIVNRLSRKGIMKIKNASVTVFMFTSGFASIVGVWGG